MVPIALNVPRTVAATGSRPGILYGLPKIHQTGISLLTYSLGYSTRSYNLS